MSVSLPSRSRSITDIDPHEVDDLIAKGWTLPAIFYTHPDIRQLEDDLIFRKAWQFVGTTLDLNKPGDYLTVKIAEVPIVVVVGDDGAVRAFVNVCIHRANVVMSGSGTCDQLQCDYHGWTYGLDGKLAGMARRLEGNVWPDGLGLRPIAADIWKGLVFVSLDPQETLLEQLGDMPQLMADAGYDFPFADPSFGLTPLAGDGNYSGVLDANWKVFYENSSECYHCPTAHADTLSVRGRGHQHAGGAAQRARKVRRGCRVAAAAAMGRALLTDPKAGSQYGFAIYSL